MVDFDPGGKLVSMRRHQIARVILHIVELGPHSYRQFSVGDLRNWVQKYVSECIEPRDVVKALKLLWRTGRVLLTKPDYYRLHAVVYSGQESGDFFFHREPFNVVTRV